MTNLLAWRNASPYSVFWLSREGITTSFRFKKAEARERLSLLLQQGWEEVPDPFARGFSAAVTAAKADAKIVKLKPRKATGKDKQDPLLLRSEPIPFEGDYE